MNKERYTVNITNDIRNIDSNTITIKSLRGRFQIKGDNISVAVRDILNCFKEPTKIDNVVSMLSKKYSVGSLQKMINFLVEKNILIDEYSSEVLQKYDKDFVDKTLYYTLGGKPLQEIVDELTPMCLAPQIVERRFLLLHIFIPFIVQHFIPEYQSSYI